MQSEDAGIERIYGVDFSGNEENAGRLIWIAEGVVREGQLTIERCMQATDLPRSSKAREICLPALRTLIGGSGNAAWGLDFPFGLPLALLGSDTWEAFILAFPERFPSAEIFKRRCFDDAGYSELRRATDEEAKTPQSPYNLRVYKQTYYGTRDILYPLVRDRQACVVPMQQRQVGIPTIYEICPASTLKARGLYGPPYKTTAESKQARERILEQIEPIFRLKIAPDIRRVVLDDSKGDALDSIIAAIAVYQAISAKSNADTGLGRKEHSLEGRVYV